MSIVVKDDGTGDYSPCPAGKALAVLCDVWDRGKVEKGGQFPGQVDTVRLYWAVYKVNGQEVRRQDGKLHTVNRDYRKSLNEKAALRKDLESYLGQTIPEEKVRQGVDLEKMLGTVWVLDLTHSPDGKWANIRGVGGVPKVDPVSGAPVQLPPMPIPDDYVRIKDRPPREEQRGQGTGRQGGPAPTPQQVNSEMDSIFGPSTGAPAGQQSQPSPYDTYKAPPLLDDDDSDMPF